MYTARDILREKGTQVHSILPDATVYEALKKMDQHNIGALVVVEGEQMVGIISERDYARKMILRGRHSQDTAVRDIMTTPVVTVTPDKDLEECMELFTDKHTRHLPVIEGEQLAGIISIGDIVKGIINHKEFVIEELEKYIKGHR